MFIPPYMYYNPSVYVSIRVLIVTYTVFSHYRTAVKDRIVAFLLFLGKLAITAAVGTYYFF